MRNLWFILLSLSFLGCTYEGQTFKDYLDDPRSIIKDPHFADYQSARDDLEKQYLNDKLEYTDYVEQMDKLDKKYAEEVQKRDQILSQ